EFFMPNVRHCTRRVCRVRNQQLSVSGTRSNVPQSVQVTLAKPHSLVTHSQEVVSVAALKRRINGLNLWRTTFSDQSTVRSLPLMVSCDIPRHRVIHKPALEPFLCDTVHPPEVIPNNTQLGRRRS